MATSISSRVREALTSAGVTQAALAKNLGLGADQVSKSMADSRNFSSTELAKIAKLTSASIEWLISGEEPTSPKFAGRITAGDVDQRSFLAWAEDFARANESLARLGYSSSMTGLPEFVPTELFVKHGQRLAEWALGRLVEFGTSPWEDGLIEHIEEAFSVDVAIVDLPTGCHGFTWQTDDFRLICVARTNNWARQRFTLAHELGHILSGDAQDKIVDESDENDWQGYFTEKSANAFAGAFLMPQAQVKALWNEAVGGDDLRSKFDEVAWTLRVSPAALGARLQKLGLIDSTQKAALGHLTMLDVATFLGHEDEFDRHSRTSFDHRPPRRLTRAYRKAYREGKVSVRPLARLYGMSPEEYLALSDQTPGEREVELTFNEE